MFDQRTYAREWARKRRLDPEYRKQRSLHSRAWQKRNPVAFSWANSKKTAQRKGYVWELSSEQFEQLILSDCVYCAAPPAPVNGVDRRDNSQGYTVENSTTACAQCNYAKKTLSVQDFLSWARRVAARHGN
jgi:hypothetical protein